MSIWDTDRFDTDGGDYVSFDKPGDGVEGTILDISAHTFPDGKRVAKFVIDTNEGELTLTAGQVQLGKKLRELRPEPGDHLAVKFTRSEKRDGGKTLKHFDVKVTKGTEEAPF